MTTTLVLLLVVMVAPRPSLDADTKVACVGDSITEGNSSVTPYPQALDALLGAGWDVHNYGNGGKTMIKRPSDNYSYWDQKQFTDAKNLAPDIVTIMLGTNDSKTVNWKSGNNTFAADYKEMVNIFLALPSKPKVYAMLPPPALSSSYTISASVIENEIIPIIRTIASETGIGIIDIFGAFNANQPRTLFGKGDGKDIDDGIHPNNNGQKLIAQTIMAVLKAAPSVDGGVGGAGDARPASDGPGLGGDARPGTGGDASGPTPDAAAAPDGGGSAGEAGSGSSEAGMMGAADAATDAGGADSGGGATRDAQLEAAAPPRGRRSRRGP